MSFFTGTTVVVGASDKRESFGYKVFKRLQEMTEVIPVNPRAPVIDGVQSVKSIVDIKEIDTLVCIVRPEIALNVVQVALQKNVQKFWFQPGSYDDAIMQFLADKNLEVSYGACVLQL